MQSASAVVLSCQTKNTCSLTRCRVASAYENAAFLKLLCDFVRTIFAYLVILGFLPLIIRATANGTLSLNLAVVLAILLVVAVCFGVEKFIFMVGVPIAGSGIFRCSIFAWRCKNILDDSVWPLVYVRRPVAQKTELKKEKYGSLNNF